jgi:hypothetical protein
MLQKLNISNSWLKYLLYISLFFGLSTNLPLYAAEASDLVISSFQSNLLYIANNSVFSTFADLVILFLILSITHKVIGKKYLLAVGIIAIVWLWVFDIGELQSAFLLILLSVYNLFRYFELKKPLFLFVAGICIALASIFNLKAGVYIYGAEFWAVFFLGVATLKEDSNKWHKILIGLKYAILIFTVGALVVAIPAFISYLYAVQFDYGISDFFTKVLNIYFGGGFNAPLWFAENNLLNIDNSVLNFWAILVFWIPLVLLILTVISLIYRVRRKIIKTSDIQFWKEILIFNIGINLIPLAVAVGTLNSIAPALLATVIIVPALSAHIANNALRTAVVYALMLCLALMPIFYYVL